MNTPPKASRFILSTIAMALILSLAPGFTTAQTIVDLTTADAVDTWNGARFDQGDGGTAAGTGIYDPFYQIQRANMRTVSGVNTGGLPVQFETVDNGAGAATELLLSTVTQVEVEGTVYRAFFLDINQTSGRSQYNILDIQIYTDDQPDLTCLLPGSQDWDTCDALPEANLIYWLDASGDGDASVRLEYTLEAGSGKRDMRMLVPDADFNAGPECNYGQDGCELYVYLYSEFNPNDDGFEEWATAVQPFVQIEKTAAGSFEEDTQWDITKSVAPAMWDLFDGETGTSEYTVAVDKTVTPGAFKVTGQITLTVPLLLPDGDETSEDANVQGLSDFFEGVEATSITCDAGPLPFVIARGETVVCDYVVDLESEILGINTATALVVDQAGNNRPFATEFEVNSSYTASPTMGSEPGTINVTDDNGMMFGPFSDDATQTYDVDFTCSGDDGTHDNIATINETGDSDNASVTVECHLLTIEKTANTMLKRTYDWTIVKNVTPATWDLFNGETGTSEYTVTWEKDDGTDSGFMVDGSITISNPHPTKAAVLTEVADLITPGDVVGNVVCAVLEVPANDDLVCTYTAEPMDDSGTTNTATATQQLYDYDSMGNPTPGGTQPYSNMADVDYTTGVMEVNSMVDITDTYEGVVLPTDVTTSGSQTYSRDFTCDADMGPHDNTASVIGDGDAELDSDDATVTVNCYEPLIVKDTETSFTRTFDWSVTKAAVPDQWDLFDGETGTSKYTVEWTKDEGDDSNFKVTGDITITNPHPTRLVELTDIVDELDTGDSDPNVDCPAMEVAAAGGTLTCSYTIEPSDALATENTATATQKIYTFDKDKVATEAMTPATLEATAPVDFGEAMITKINDSIDVTDDVEGSLATGEMASGMAMYDHTFSCDADEGENPNTASILGDDGDDEGEEPDVLDTASENVNVACYDVGITKEVVTTALTRAYTWVITKEVEPAQWDLFDGDTGTSEYTVTWTKSEGQESGFMVKGSITISNPHPTREIVLNDVTDVITPGDFAAMVDCGDAETVPAEGELVCSYMANPEDGDGDTNTATAIQQVYDFDWELNPTDAEPVEHIATADIDFSGAIVEEINGTVDIKDDVEGDLSLEQTTSGSKIYEHTFACDADAGENPNIASIIGDGDMTIDSDDANVLVNCYQLAVTKDADESYTRTWSWTIEKSADQDVLNLAENQLFTVNYEAGLTAASADNGWAVAGKITITNNHPSLPAMLTSVTDEITDFGPIEVDCGDITSVPAEGSIECSYESGEQDSEGVNPFGDTNTATATMQNKAYHHTDEPADLETTFYMGESPVNFEEVDPTEIDECVTVTDTFAGELGELCADAESKIFMYTLEIGTDIPVQCGENIVTNIASFESNDTPVSGESQVDITVNVMCDLGCTLTQGYWKTHNESFQGGARPDDTWLSIGDSDGDGEVMAELEFFYLSGQTWFDVFWTAPKGNSYYNLAHQYMAAVLNKLKGASSLEQVEEAIAYAEDLFASNTPDEIGALKGRDKKDIIEAAGVLASYNEGLIGPGHCDEDESSFDLESTEELAEENGMDAADPNTGREGSESNAVVASTGEAGEDAGMEVDANGEDIAEIPTAFNVGNYPNPFNPSTTVRLELPETARVSILVFDVQGRQVARLTDGSLAAGVHEVVWDAGSLPSGTYFMVVRTSDIVETRSLVLMK